MPTHSLNVFSVPSMSDIGTLLKATKSSYPLDLIPLSLLHEITNPSLSLSIIYYVNPSNPVRFQHPIIMHSLHPCLRNQTLTLRASIIIVKSNLSIFTKTLERIIAKQLTYYLISHKIPHIFQIAYIPSKSTETALAKISSDILTNIDNKNGTILALFYLSTHFTPFTTRFSYTILHI